MKNSDPAVKKALEPISDPTNEDLAEAAVAIEQAAQSEPDNFVYVHTFSRPFQWDTLTGADHLEIEFEMMKQGKTLVVPEFTGEYLCGMAVRACDELREIAPPTRKIAMKALPLKDFSAICSKARSFLMRSESLPETEDWLSRSLLELPAWIRANKELTAELAENQRR